MLDWVADSIVLYTGEGCSTQSAESVLKLMRGKVGREFNTAHRHLLPMTNGVLNTETLALEPHNAEYGFTWQIPYAYGPEKSGKPIVDWLYEAQQGNEDFVNVLLAFARATLLGKFDLQIYLEIFGRAGTGKSTYIKLLKALVGAENAVQTDLETLEKNRFETQRLYGKRLVFMPHCTRQNHTG